MVFVNPPLRVNPVPALIVTSPPFWIKGLFNVMPVVEESQKVPEESCVIVPFAPVVMADAEVIVILPFPEVEKKPLMFKAPVLNTTVPSVMVVGPRKLEVLELAGVVVNTKVCPGLLNVIDPALLNVKSSLTRIFKSPPAMFTLDARVISDPKVVNASKVKKPVEVLVIAELATMLPAAILPELREVMLEVELFV